MAWQWPACPIQILIKTGASNAKTINARVMQTVTNAANKQSALNLTSPLLNCLKKFMMILKNHISRKTVFKWLMINWKPLWKHKWINLKGMHSVLKPTLVDSSYQMALEWNLLVTYNQLRKLKLIAERSKITAQVQWGLVLKTTNRELRQPWARLIQLL